ncbi:porin [Phyllobacterium myrsinacearum]|uniref:Porin n=1 Tax=Phyllobacterium myrsinacearum TaxID=28101 RepID=A0A2S9JPD6_9HYPH|nr:porin [Phyllobacterium myrsinacearum]PRD55103.1 porin [Phyllobacterium myrsinacearum]PWV90332.1 porin-like protein [Phyllobacterium myrsinacearum]RZV05473.1 porin-like protein [Phyllobacterium myrsinacearum]
MTIKSFLLGSAAALVAVSGARAADAVVVAEPEAVEYVRVCDAYGKGFFYIPGTETCLKIGGYLRYDAKGGDNVYKGGEFGTWQKKTRATLRFDARSETELGTLRSYIEARFQYNNGANDTSIPNAYIELGGFRIGVADEIFGSFTGYAGNVINDDVINYQSDHSNQVSYTFNAGNGFSAMIGAEQGESVGNNYYSYDYRIDDYMPHVLAGAKYEQSWGKISGIVGYDSRVEEWAGKLRLDVKFTDTVSAWVMGGYQTNYDDAPLGRRNWFGTWEGDYAIWGGLAAKVSDKATINAQLAYESEGTLAGALNVAYEIVPGFTITPEFNYTKFDGARKDYSLAHGGNDDAFGGAIRFQRNF